MYFSYLRHSDSQLFLIIKLLNRRFSWQQNQFQVWKLEPLCKFATGSIYQSSKISFEWSGYIYMALYNLRSVFTHTFYLMYEIPWERSRADKENVVQWRSMAYSRSQELVKQKGKHGSSWFPAQGSSHHNRLLWKPMEFSEILREPLAYHPAIYKLKSCQLKSDTQDHVQHGKMLTTLFICSFSHLKTICWGHTMCPALCWHLERSCE